MPLKLVNLAEYVPLFISDIDTIRRFFAMVEPEFRLLWNLYLKILLNKRPETADNEGLWDWETMLGIRHDGTIPNRRERVKLRMARNNRYTFNYLVRLMEAFAGTGRYEIDDSLLYTDFKLKIKVILPVIDDLKEVMMICSHEGIISSHIGIDFEVVEEVEYENEILTDVLNKYQEEIDISGYTTSDGTIFAITIE